MPSEYSTIEEIVSVFLLKDILEFDGTRNAHKIRSLLRLVAFQIGNEVLLSELALKLNEKKKFKIPSVWAKAYPDSEFTVINHGNYLTWISG